MVGGISGLIISLVGGYGLVARRSHGEVSGMFANKKLEAQMVAHNQMIDAIRSSVVGAIQSKAFEVGMVTDTHKIMNLTERLLKTPSAYARTRAMRPNWVTPSKHDHGLYGAGDEFLHAATATADDVGDETAPATRGGAARWRGDGRGGALAAVALAATAAFASALLHEYA